MAATHGTRDPDLFAKLFNPEEVSESSANFEPGIGEIFQPTTAEELEEMFAMWDAEQSLHDLGQD